MRALRRFKLLATWLTRGRTAVIAVPGAAVLGVHRLPGGPPEDDFGTFLGAMALSLLAAATWSAVDTVTSPLDAANILKPALSRGEIACIGATTMKEYRKYIEKDRSLERRFQAVKVASPTGGRFGSAKARTRQVPVGADETSVTASARPPTPWSGTSTACARSP